MDINEQLTAEQVDAVWDEEAGSPGDQPALDATQTDDATQGDVTEPAAAQAAAAQVQQPEDPLAALTRRLDESIAANGNLANTVNSLNGRVRTLQSELEKSAAAAATVAAAGVEAPNAAQIAAAAKTPEKWAAVKADFPEWADAMEEFVASSLAGIKPAQAAAPAAPALSEEKVGQITQAAIQQAIQQREYGLVESRHKGWRDTVKTPEFQAWMKAQPENVKALAASDYAIDAIQLFDLYKTPAQRQATDLTARRTQRLQLATTTKPGQTAAVRAEDALSPDEIWDQEAKRLEQQRQA